MTRHFLLGEAAKILGRRPHQIAYLITTGQVPEPERRIANKRLFTERDVVRLARKLRTEPDWSSAGGATECDQDELPEGLMLNPPFGVVQDGQSRHEIRDGDGEVFAWASDRARALIVAGLLEGAVP